MTTALLISMFMQAASTSVAPTIPAGDALVAEMRRVDDEFFRLGWKDCEAPEKAAVMISPDHEMYHDRNGISFGTNQMMQFLKWRCDELNTKGRATRSETVAGTFRVDPLPGFGAVTSGERRFYYKDRGEPETAIGQASVTIIWKKTADGWQAHRTLSLNHRDAPE